MSYKIENVKTTSEAAHNASVFAREALHNLKAAMYYLVRMTEDGMPDSLRESVQGDREWAKEKLAKYRTLMDTAQKVIFGEGISI